MSFTKIKDVDLNILQGLEDEDFERVCQVNKYVNKLCGEESFWLNRFLLKKDYDLDEIKKMKGDFTYRELYKYLYIDINNKNVFIEAARRDNIHFYKELNHNGLWTVYDKELTIKDAAENGSLQILTYLFIIDHRGDDHEQLSFLVSMFANEKTSEWLKTMDQLDYDAYLVNLVTTREEAFGEIKKYLNMVSKRYHPELYYELGKSLSEFTLDSRIQILEYFISQKMEGLDRAIEGAYEFLKKGDKLDKWVKYIKTKM